MTKIFPSPGLSSRPLTRRERLREYWRNLRYLHESGILGLIFEVYLRDLRHPIRAWRERRELKRLLDALALPSYEGKPSSLESTLREVTFNPNHIRRT